MHKFSIGQAVSRIPRGIDAVLVTATLPERGGQFEYRIRAT
jgi:hypothetical protein